MNKIKVKVKFPLREKEEIFENISITNSNNMEQIREIAFNDVENLIFNEGKIEWTYEVIKDENDTE